MPYYLSKHNKKAAHSESNVSKNEVNKAKRKPNLIKRLDKVFSMYIRLRDVMPSGYGKCISCGKIKSFEELDCGHFHSRIHMATRFDEDNCSAECRFCNRFSADHLIAYEKNLKRKIGENRFNLLNVKAHSCKHWSDYELDAMIKHYKNEARKLSSLKGIRINL